MPSKLKEVLRAHLEHGEQRLRDQQRQLAQQRRMSKVHENVMSEEEKKKRRKKLKVRGEVGRSLPSEPGGGGACPVSQGEGGRCPSKPERGGGAYPVSRTLFPPQKQMSLQEPREPEAYPTTTSLPRQQTIGEHPLRQSTTVSQ